MTNGTSTLKDESIGIGVWRYDRTQAFFDGRVGIQGQTISMKDEPLETLFSKAFTTADYEVSELSLSNFIRMKADGDCAYHGIPIFPSRSFRHGAFYVREDSNITDPRQLIGAKVGVREYSMTAALAARGALRDQFDIESSQINWVVGDVNERERLTIELPKLYRKIPIEVAKGNVLLDAMLLAGDLDAILAYKPIKSAIGVDAKARRLFADVESVEKDYFRKTGIFPIMHLIGVRVLDADRRPGLVRNTYDAFIEAQKLASEDLAYEQALKIGLPWLGQELQRTISVMGENFWPQGFSANRHVLETMINWSFLDGMISKRIAPESLFFNEMLST